jgi:hypothetical protein
VEVVNVAERSLVVPLTGPRNASHWPVSWFFTLTVCWAELLETPPLKRIVSFLRAARSALVIVVQGWISERYVPPLRTALYSTLLPSSEFSRDSELRPL